MKENKPILSGKEIFFESLKREGRRSNVWVSGQRCYYAL